MPGRMEFEYRFGTSGARQPVRPDADEPFRVLVIGDLRGDAGRAAAAAPARTIAIDADNFDAVLARLAPALELPGGTGDGGTTVPFRSLDDFHPDALYARLEIFRALRDMRVELLNPATFAAAFARLQGGAAAPPPPADAAQPESDTDALARLLGRAPRDAGAAVLPGLAGLLHQVMAPHIVPGQDPRTDSVVASVDAASEGLMRAILHSPGYRALESTWRGLHRLVTSESRGEGVEVHVCDAAASGLAADVLANKEALEHSALGQALAERADGPGGVPWSLIVAAYTFGPGESALHTLAALGALAHRCGAPLVGHASPALFGCSSFGETPSHTDWRALPEDAQVAWGALRRGPDAPWIALAAPRVLLRQPYGRKSDPVERFAFEELPAGGAHESLPWGHPGFALAELLVASFADSGFEMEPGNHRELGELPACTIERHGESALVPCAEAWLSEATVNALLERGLTAIVSVRNRPEVQVPRFQSIAEPPAPLAGPWS